MGELHSGDVNDDVTALVDRMVERLRGTTHLATDTWRQCAERLFKQFPTILHDLREPEVPVGSYAPGTPVQVRWLPEGTPQDRENYLNAHIASVHRDGRCVVQYEYKGPWGDTERGVA